MPKKPPLADSYGAAVAIGLLALCPYIVLTTAMTALTPIVAKALSTDRGALQLVDGMSNAGYAVGAVLAAYLAQKWLQRRLFMAYEIIFVVGSIVAVTAATPWQFGVGRVLQGFATGLLLVSALPPLVTRFGVGKLPVTVVIVNVGLFGATTAGPLLGGVAAGGPHGWRVLFVIVAVLGALGFAAGALGYARFDPPNPDLRLGRSVLPLAVAGTVLPFFATSVVARTGFLKPLFLVPFVVGLAALVALIVTQYRADDPLMPVKALSTQLPVTGTVVAMVAGAAFVATLQLVQTYLAEVAKTASLLPYAGLPIGLVVAAVLFGVLFRTRFVPVLVNVGFLALIAAAAVLLQFEPHLIGRTFAAGTLLGFGAGATVSPGLFLAALGVRSESLGRAFALVELLRSEAAFAVAPVVLAVAQGSQQLPHGVHQGVVAMLWLSVAGLVLSVGIPVVSGARLRRPDLDAWINDGERALPTPLVASLLRPNVDDPAAEPIVRRDR